MRGKQETMDKTVSSESASSESSSESSSHCEKGEEETSKQEAQEEPEPEPLKPWANSEEILTKEIPPKNTSAREEGEANEKGDRPQERLPKTNARTKKTGMIYLSHIPSGMEVTTLRSLLNRVGPTGQIWLRPIERAGKRASAVAMGTSRPSEQGSKRRQRSTSFRDGWVEFDNRRHAKAAIALLNGRSILGGKRRGKFSNDIWAMRYLPKYSWDDLGREVFGNPRERVLKVREEVASARRERAWVEQRVDISHRLAKAPSDETPVVRRFAQRSVVEDADDARARLAAERLDRDLEAGVQRDIDPELVAGLFKKRKVQGQ